MARRSSSRKTSRLVWLILRRITLGVATLFAVSTIVFFGVAALPGNAATAVLGAQVNNKVAVREKERALGLDRPLVDRYFSWLGGAVHGDLGVSASSEQPISGIIGSELRNTAALALLTMIVCTLAIGLGVISALKRDTVLDHGVATATLTFLSTPRIRPRFAARGAIRRGARPAAIRIHSATAQSRSHRNSSC